MTLFLLLEIISHMHVYNYIYYVHMYYTYMISIKCLSSHVPRDGVWVNDRPHIGRWSREIITGPRHSSHPETSRPRAVVGPRSSRVRGDAGVARPLCCQPCDTESVQCVQSVCLTVDTAVTAPWVCQGVLIIISERASTWHQPAVGQSAVPGRLLSTAPRDGTRSLALH